MERLAAGHLRLSRPVSELGLRLGHLGGEIESGPPRVVDCHVPVDAGVAAVEQTLDESAATLPGAGRAYTNLYADDEGTVPLNWWTGT